MQVELALNYSNNGVRDFACQTSNVDPLVISNIWQIKIYSWWRTACSFFPRVHWHLKHWLEDTSRSAPVGKLKTPSRPVSNSICVEFMYRTWWGISLNLLFLWMNTSLYGKWCLSILISFFFLHNFEKACHYLRQSQS